MTHATIWEAMTEIFRDLFDDPTLTIGPDTTAYDVPGWDSLMHIQLLVAVESRFGVRLSTAQVTSLSNVGELMTLITAAGTGRGAPGLATASRT